MSPNFANLQGSCRVGHVCTLDEHPFEDGHIFRNDRNVYFGTWNFLIVIVALGSVVVLISLH